MSSIARAVYKVSKKRGFLPFLDPYDGSNYDKKKYGQLNFLLSEMPVKKRDGSTGLLGKNELGLFIEKEFKQIDLSDLNKASDPMLIASLFRDFSFLASGYLLEPCHHNFEKFREYGLARDTLPSNIAKPLVHISSLLGSRPFMEYNQSYGLTNWKRIDKKKPAYFENLKAIRLLQGSKAEEGFILVHVDMVSLTNSIVTHIDNALNAAEKKDYQSTATSLSNLVYTMSRIHEKFTKMWSRSNHNDYMQFRTWIYGIKNQSMFPNGVKYLGCGDDKKQHYYKGESGANDSIIPSIDNLLQLKFPDNPLTRELKDFRSYRPLPHIEYLESIVDRASLSKFRDFCFSQPETLQQYINLLNENRKFRQLHWNLTKKYIIEKSNYPTATGGTPITQWLPNQLKTVLNLMIDANQKLAEFKQNEKLEKELETDLSQLSYEVNDFSSRIMK